MLWLLSTLADDALFANLLPIVEICLLESSVQCIVQNRFDAAATKHTIQLAPVLVVYSSVYNKSAPSMRLTKDLKGCLGCFMTGERMSKVNAWCHQKHFAAMSYAPRIEWRYNCRRNRTLGWRRICNFYKPFSLLCFTIRHLLEEAGRTCNPFETKMKLRDLTDFPSPRGGISEWSKVTRDARKCEATNAPKSRPR